MKEKEFWEKFRPMFQLHTQYCERIENRANQGTPDVFCLGKDGTAIWVELKSTKSIQEKPVFQPQQPVWHKKYALSGGKSYVVVHCGDKIYGHLGSDIDDFWTKNFQPSPHLTADIKNKDSVTLFFENLFGE